MGRSWIAVALVALGLAATFRDLCASQHRHLYVPMLEEWKLLSNLWEAVLPRGCHE